MASFKTAINALSRGELKFEVVSDTLIKLLTRQPEAAVSIMAQLREAYTENLIDAGIYASLKKVVYRQAGIADDESQLPPDSVELDKQSIAAQARAAMDVISETNDPLDFDLTGDDESSLGSWQAEALDIGVEAPHRAPEPEAKIEPGSVLKDRFKLDHVLGVGGMGTVYRGRDLIKVEARDKNPYLALKVLNEDFKKHPDSFIALQREASRQQKLAHPNIATVYDFDRTRGGTVFLTMELLEGEPLNTLIKKEIGPNHGLPFDQAFPMIEGLGKALIYAHDHGIVHSDFKPGNCFQTKDGTMKVLDFGIARAVKNPGQSEGEKTLFDPAKLGALTPAYASAEMLEGEEPDPRDDLYALACVSYQLLTGQHPFNKTPANTARDNKLVPPPVKGLKRRQLKGLMRGLAFTREDRSQNVAEFLEQLEGQTSPLKNPAIMVPAAIAVIALVAAAPVINYLNKHEIEQKITLVRSGDPAKIESVLSELDDPDASASDRDRILVATRTEILNYFDNKINKAVDDVTGRYNFAEANALIDRLAAIEIFKDSAQVQKWRTGVANTERVLLNEQTVSFNESLAANRLLPMDQKDDIHDALNTIATFSQSTVDALKRRLPGHYSAAIARAIVNEEFDLANKLSAAGLETIPGNKNLLNILAKIDGAEERAALAHAILNHSEMIQAAMRKGDRLANFFSIQDDVKNLVSLDRDHELLQALASQVRRLADEELSVLANDKQWATSDLIQGDYSVLLRSLGLYRQDTLATKYRAEFGTAVSELTARISAAVTQAVPAATRNTAGLLASLEAIAPRHPRTLEAHEIVARSYLQHARVARAGQQFTQAKDQLDAAREFAKGTEVIAAIDVESEIIAGDIAADAARREQRLAARLKEFDKALVLAENEFSAIGSHLPSVKPALTTFDTLRSLSPSDKRLVALQRKMIDGITQMVDQLATAKRWEAALQAIRTTLAYAPGSQSLVSNFLLYEEKRREGETDQRSAAFAQRKGDIEALLAKADVSRQWSEDVRRNMADIYYLSASDNPWIEEIKHTIASVYVARATAAREAERFAEGANLLDSAQRYAPDHVALVAERLALSAASDAFELEQREQERAAGIEGLKQDFMTQANANDVGSATKTLALLQRDLGDSNPFVVDRGPNMLADAYARLAKRHSDEQDPAGALALAKAGLKLRPQRQTLQLAVKDYTVDGNRQELQRIFGRDDEFDLAEVLERMSEIQTLDPRAFSESESTWSTAVTSRIHSLQKSSGIAANPLLERAQEVFPGNVVIAAIEPATPSIADEPARASVIRAALDARLLTRARTLLANLSASEAEHPTIVNLEATYRSHLQQPEAIYAQYEAEFEATDYESALVTVKKARNLWQDNELYRTKISELESTINGIPLSESPCASHLAGLGKRKKGTCFDMISASARGPVLVVVPSSDAFPKAFAIGKYEVTVGDFNNYCGSTGSCDVVTDRENDLPITGVSLNQVRAYSTWLSKLTAKVYRLPTAAEWAYAADAEGQQPRKDYNCRVAQGDTILKGQAPLRVTSGKANGWGLYNYVGNAQEWVRTANGYAVRGGAFNDTFSECKASLEKAHTGNADNSTGFRVLQELG